MAFVYWLLSPLGRALGLIGAVLLAVSYIYLKGRSAGVNAEREKLRTATKRVRDLHNEIDRRDMTLEEAIKRLSAP